MLQLPKILSSPLLLQGKGLPTSARTLATSARLSSSRSDSPFDRPGPPPLPKEDQKEWNRLVKERGNELQFNRPSPSPSASIKSSSSPPSINESDIHPNARKPPPPDFEGEENPVTGEIGGPKKDPLQWEREWTYGGRATDF